MDPILILAMVLAAGATRAYEQAKAEGSARWHEATRRAGERTRQQEQEREKRAQQWEKQFDQAISTGPRHPLWWVYATGFVLGGAVTATAAGAVGAYSGAIAGGRSGYKVGKSAGESGRKYHEAWKEWRKRNPRTRIVLAQCAICLKWTNKDSLAGGDDSSPRCSDCVLAGSKDENRARTNHSAKEAGPEFVSSVIHEESREPSCCQSCGLELIGRQDEREICLICSIEEDIGDPASGWDDRKENPYGMDQEYPERIFVRSERADDGQKPTEKENAQVMAALPAGTQANLGATGENYADTLATLTQLASLLTAAHECVTALGDNLTANDLDQHTLGEVNDLIDLLDAAGPKASGLCRHLEEVHAPVAEAVAAAGGSHNVASRNYYDGM